MYGKIFESIYDGSLYGEFEAIVVFKAMIVLADEHGNLDMSPQAIAGRTSYPIDIVKKGLAVLQKPDPDSRQPDHEGRRIVPLENGRSFGWHIVNYKYYRDLANREAKKEADRIRIAEKRKKDKQNNGVADCSGESQEVAEVAHTDTDTDTNKNKRDAQEAKLPSPVDGRFKTFSTFLDQVDKSEEKALPAGHCSLEYAEKIGLTNELMELAWWKFKSEYSPIVSSSGEVTQTKKSKKKYKDWRLVFYNVLKDNWYGLWYIDDNNNVVETSKARQTRIAMKSEEAK